MGPASHLGISLDEKEDLKHESYSARPVGPSPLSVYLLVQRSLPLVRYMAAEQEELSVKALMDLDLRQWQGLPLLKGWPPSSARRCLGLMRSTG